MEEILDIITDIVAPELLPVLEIVELATDAMLAPDTLETVGLVNETGEYVSKAADGAMAVIGPGAVIGGVASGAFSDGGEPFKVAPGQKFESIGSGELPQVPVAPTQPGVMYDPADPTGGHAVPKAVYEPFKAQFSSGPGYIYGAGCMGGFQFLRPKNRKRRKRNKIYML
jgi:hypothetical protein